MRLRVMIPADIAVGMRLKDLAGWNQTPADWERFLRASPEGCFVAESEGQVTGTVTTIVYENRFAWIGMVLVDAAYRGRGVGTRLLEKAVEYLDSQSVPTLKLDATPQGRAIYEKLGFAAEYEIERWVLKRAAMRERSQQPATRKLARPDLDRMLTLDRHVFGADRSELLRSLDHESPDFTLALSARDGTGAYAFGRCGSHADHLGPWMARDEASAGHLLEEFLRRSRRDLVFVDGLRSNPFALDLLGAHGFEFVRPLTRMCRGPNRFPGRSELLCAILGPEFG